MINETIYGLVKESILSDRNMKAGNVSEVKITNAYIELTIEDNNDKIKIKRLTKDNLKTYWNITMMNDDDIQQFVKTHHITFSEFRQEFESLVKDIHGDIDLEACVNEALANLSDQKITSNVSRVAKSHNTGKKREEIHGKKENGKEPLGLPEGKQEPLGLPEGEIKDAEKVDEIEEAEEIKDDPKDEFLTDEEKKKLQGEDEDLGEETKRKVIASFIAENAPFTFRATEISEMTGFETADCTRITLELIEENRIFMQKKGKSGKNGIYGSILVPVES